MKKIKRFIAFLLCFCLVTGYFTAVSASSVTGADLDEKIELLKFLGIADSSLDVETVNLNETVSRAEYAQYLVKFLNITQKPSGKLYYNDIPKTHYAYDEITVLTDLGYFKGVGAKTFNPEDAMKTKYVFGTVLSALGYGAILSTNISDENYAQAICAQNGILNGVKTLGDDLNLGAILSIMYNALLANTYGMNSSFDELVESDDTLLYTTRKMRYEKKGYVTAVGDIDIYGKNSSDDIMIIDGVEYDMPDFNAEDFIGRKVKFIYSEDKNNYVTEKKIEWMRVTDEAEALEIYADPDTDFNKTTGRLSYEDANGKNKTVDIPESIVMIYNGKFLNSGIKDVLSHSRYKLTLLKTNGSEYSTAVVSEYYNMVVDYKNNDDLKVFGKNAGENLSFDKNDYDKLEIFSDSGSAMTFEAITVNSVLSIYKSSDGKNVKVRVSPAQASGKVTQCDDYKMKIGDKTYEFYDPDENSEEYLGKQVTLYLDADGYAAYCTVQSTQGSFVGFMIKGRLVEDNASGEVIKFKILKEDGNIETFDSSERIKINDKYYRNDPEGALKSISAGGTGAKPQMVRVELTADNKVQKLSTAYEDDGTAHDLIISKRLEKLDGDSSDADFSYHSVSGGRIGRIMSVDSNTKIFFVPQDSDIDGASDRYFRVGSLPSGSYPSAISYRTKLEADFMEEYVLIRSSAVTDKLNEYPSMFDSVRDVLDSDGNVIKKVLLYDNEGNEKDIEIDSEFDFMSYRLKRGDLFRYAQSDMTNRITNIEVTYQPSKNIIKTRGTLTEEYRIMFGYAHNVCADGIWLGYESGANYDETMNMKTPGITKAVVYDKEEDKIIVGDYSYIKPYKSYGDECSAVVALTWYTAFRGMFVYR